MSMHPVLSVNVSRLPASAGEWRESLASDHRSVVVRGVPGGRQQQHAAHVRHHPDHGQV